MLSKGQGTTDNGLTRAIDEWKRGNLTSEQCEGAEFPHRRTPLMNEKSISFFSHQPSTIRIPLFSRTASPSFYAARRPQ
jgi:hypothetical protein